MAIIEVANLHKRYGENVAVEDVGFSVDEGEIFGVLGPNGAGKTTTVECVSGMRTADGGHLRVLGLDPVTDPATEVTVDTSTGADIVELLSESGHGRVSERTGRRILSTVRAAMADIPAAA